MTLDTYAELFEEDLDAVSTALNNIAGPAIVGKMWANKLEEGESESSKARKPLKFRGFAGGSDGRRSRDLTIFSRALYQLSYRALSKSAA